MCMTYSTNFRVKFQTYIIKFFTNQIWQIPRKTVFSSSLYPPPFLTTTKIETTKQLKEECRSINSNQSAFQFSIVRSHLSPERNRTCYVPRRRRGSFGYWRTTNGSPGEYKHFKSLLPLSAASIYSQQTAGSQVIQYFPSFLVPEVLFLSREKERASEGVNGSDRSRDNITSRSIDHRAGEPGSLSQSTRNLGQDNRPGGTAPRGIERGSPGGTYKMARCTMLNRARVLRRGPGWVEGKGRGNDWMKGQCLARANTHPQGGTRGSRNIEGQGLLGASVKGMSLECNASRCLTHMELQELFVQYRRSLLQVIICSCSYYIFSCI